MSEYLMRPDYDGAVPEGLIGWIPQAAFRDRGVAVLIAAEEYNAQTFEAGAPYVNPARLKATGVLMREESEIEAQINGHEFPHTVECTDRARRPEPYWRIEVEG